MDVAHPSKQPEQFQNNLSSLKKSFKELCVILPFWISFRQGSRICSTPKPQPRSSSPVDNRSTLINTASGVASSVCEYASSFLSAVGSKVPQATKKRAIAIGNAATLGMLSRGYMSGMFGYYRRRLDVVTEELRLDVPETKSVDRTVRNIITCLSGILGEMASSSKESNSLWQEVDGILFSGSKIKEHQFLSWSALVINVMNAFSNILRRSLLPYDHVTRSYDSIGNEANFYGMDFSYCAEELVGCLADMESLKTLTYENLKAIESLLEAEQPSGESLLSRSELQRVEDGNNSSSALLCEILSCDSSHKKFLGIDEWLKNVRGVFSSSAESAEFILRVLDVSGLSRTQLCSNVQRDPKKFRNASDENSSARDEIH